MLLANAGKAPRERLTLIRVFEALRGLGYEGGYDAVRRYAKGWRRTRTAVTAPAFVPLVFAPGEAYQFDCATPTRSAGLTRAVTPRSRWGPDWKPIRGPVPMPFDIQGSNSSRRLMG